MKGSGSRLSAAFHVFILPGDYVRILQKSKTVCGQIVKNFAALPIQQLLNGPHALIDPGIFGKDGMELFNNYIVPVIVGICLIVGYIVKNFTGADNKFIPAMVTAPGVALAVWMNWPAITPEVILGGAVSGLASTGMHQLFKQWIDNGCK